MRSLSTTFPANGLMEKYNVKRYKYAENAFLPKIVTVPLVQGDGCVCRNIVKIGDTVEEGDVIGIPLSGTQKGTKIHSPIPGKVIAIVPCQMANGKIEHAIQIKLEGEFSFLGKKRKEIDWKNLSSEKIIDSFYENGVVNTFSISKIECLGSQIDEMNSKNNENKAVIVRLFDEDPSRMTDSLVSQFEFEKVRTAAYICANALKTKNILYLVSNTNENQTIAENLRISEFISKTKKNETVKVDKTEQNEITSEKLSEENENSDNKKNNKHNKEKNNLDEQKKNDEFNEQYVIISQKKYPYSLPREVLLSVNKPFKKSIGFNISNDDLFIDSSSLLQVYDAVVSETPVLSKYVHFSGDCLNVSCFLQVKIGTKLSDIVGQLGQFYKTPKQIIVNGVITGSEISNLDVPLTKDVKSVVFNSKYNLFDLNIFACVNCGNCRNVCPVKISPDILYNALSMKHKISDLQYKSSLLCTGCGLCNTVCPSRLPLSQSMKIMATKNRNGEQI